MTSIKRSGRVRISYCVHITTLNQGTSLNTKCSAILVTRRNPTGAFRPEFGSTSRCRGMEGLEGHRVLSDAWQREEGLEETAICIESKAQPPGARTLSYLMQWSGQSAVQATQNNGAHSSQTWSAIPFQLRYSLSPEQRTHSIFHVSSPLVADDEFPVVARKSDPAGHTRWHRTATRPKFEPKAKPDNNRSNAITDIPERDTAR